MVLEANGRDIMVANELCDPSTRPQQERGCVVSESHGCDTQWDEDEWGEVRGVNV